MTRHALVQVPVVQPMLATPGAVPSQPEEWAFEVKWDGMRVVSYLDGAGGLRLLSRNGNDATVRYPELAELARALPRDAALDGEVIATDQRGLPSFGRLQERMTLRRPSAVRAAAAQFPVTLMLFDVLWLDGGSTTALPYRERRALLESLGLKGGHTVVPPVWPGRAAAEAVAWTREHGLEGVVAKRLSAAYRPGVRSRDWLKVKHIRTLDVVVVGWVPGGPRGTALTSLLLAVPDTDGLRYVGAVGTGFPETERRALATLLRRLDVATAPLTRGEAGIERGVPVKFVRPVLTGEVEFLEYTAAGLLRQPVWKGLRGEHGA